MNDRSGYKKQRLQTPREKLHNLSKKICFNKILNAQANFVRKARSAQQQSVKRQ